MPKELCNYNSRLKSLYVKKFNKLNKIIIKFCNLKNFFRDLRSNYLTVVPNLKDCTDLRVLYVCVNKYFLLIYNKRKFAYEAF